MDQALPATPELGRNRAEWQKLADILAQVQKNLIGATNPQTVLKLTEQTTALRNSMTQVNADWAALKNQILGANQAGLSFADTFSKVSRSSGMSSLLGSQIGSLFGGAGRGIGSAIGAVTGAIGGAKEAKAEGAGTGATALAAAIPLVGAAKAVVGIFGDAAQGLLGLPMKIAGMFQSELAKVASYVKFSDPGRVQRLDMAFEDLYAAIGSGLVPIVDAAIVVVDQLNQVFTGVMQIMRPVFAQVSSLFQRFFGDVLGRWQPVMEAFASRIADGVDRMGPAFEVLFGSILKISGVFADLAIGPVLSMFEVSLSVAVSAIQVFAEAARRAANFIQNPIGGFAQLFTGGGEALNAVGGNGPTGPRSVAARQARTIGIEQIGEEARLAAFGSRSSTQILADMTEGNTNATLANTNALTELGNFLSGLLGSGTGASALTGGADQAAGAVESLTSVVQNGLQALTNFNPVNIILRPFG